jgi:glutathionyl-hydroquinone reductase
MKGKFNVPFLVDVNGNEFNNSNEITRLLNKIFDKKIGSSMLRNIYLTSKYSNNLQNLKEDANAMGTSSNTAENQYIKLDSSKSKSIDV